MSWVPRIPMRPDFCGCPPCPWCYAWAGDERLGSPSKSNGQLSPSPAEPQIEPCSIPDTRGSDLPVAGGGDLQGGPK